MLTMKRLIVMMALGLFIGAPLVVEAGERGGYGRSSRSAEPATYVLQGSPGFHARRSQSYPTQRNYGALTGVRTQVERPAYYNGGRQHERYVPVVNAERMWRQDSRVRYVRNDGFAQRPVVQREERGWQARERSRDNNLGGGWYRTSDGTIASGHEIRRQTHGRGWRAGVEF